MYLNNWCIYMFLCFMYWKRLEKYLIYVKNNKNLKSLHNKCVLVHSIHSFRIIWKNNALYIQTYMSWTLKQSKSKTKHNRLDDDDLIIIIIILLLIQTMTSSKEKIEEKLKFVRFFLYGISQKYSFMLILLLCYKCIM